MMYVARATGRLSFTEEDPSVQAIRRRYAAEGITSEVVSIQALYVHYLEGPREVVGAMVGRLATTPMLQDAVVINFGSIEHRTCRSPLAIRSLDLAAVEALPLLPELL
eukprot:EG_transcript_60901